MKKIVWYLLLCMTLSSCTLSKDASVELEKHASLQVEVSNKAYGKALVSLWNTLYPEQKDAIHIVSPDN